MSPNASTSRPTGQAVGMIADTIGASQANGAFAKLETERNSMILEDHPILLALNDFITRHTTPEWIVSGKLFETIKNHNPQFPIKTAQTFGQQLNNLSSNLRSSLDIQFRTGSHNIREVRLAKLGSIAPANSPSEIVQQIEAKQKSKRNVATYSEVG